MTTTTDLAVRNGHGTAALAIRPGQEMFSDKQRAALAVLGIKDATNADLAVFMHYCQKTGLDPFSRQIYMICRREKVDGQYVAKQTIQVGIDGFRVIRDRIARREGLTVEYEDTVWYDADGGAHAVWLWDEAPAACRVVVLKDGHRYPAVLRTASYMATKQDGTPVSQWKTQPDHMIEKCAEAYALRRAFPHDLGGIYLDDEMPPVPADVPARPQRVTAAEITGQQAPAAQDDTRSRSASRAGQAHERAAGESTAREDDRPRAAGAAPSRGAQPPAPQGQPAPKGMALKLDKLLGQLQLGPDEDVRALLEHLAGAEWTATRSQVQLVTGILTDHLEACQGDTAEAASAIWAQYNVATAQAGAEDSQDAPGGDVSP